jgi:hypothetical protein
MTQQNSEHPDSVDVGSSILTAESLAAKHTPGPWHFHAKLSGSENHRGYRVYGPGADGWILAEVIPVDEDGIEGGANARLIASAPELLEALEDMVDLITEGLVRMQGARIYPAGEERIEAARAAIAKATQA